MSKTISIIDYMMGTGKTTHIMNFMNNNAQDKYIYVTPLLFEAKSRVVNACASIEMKSPSDRDENNLRQTKGDHLLELLQSGSNISTTHKMFKDLTLEHIALIKEQQYIIILDEVLDYIQPYNEYSQDDVKDLFERGDLVADQNNLGRVSMTWDVSKGNHYKKLHDVCSVGMLYSTIKPENLLNIQIPPIMLDAAKKVIVMTYMFRASSMCAFFKLHKYETEFLHVPELAHKEVEVKKSLKQRLEFIEIKMADKIVNKFRDTSLSYSWWDKAVKEGYAKDYMKTISNWLANNYQLTDSFYFCTPKNIVSNSTSKVNKRNTSLLSTNKLRYLVNTSEFTNEDHKVIDKPITDQDLEELDRDDVLDVTVRPSKWIPVNTKATNLYRKRNLCLCLMNIYPNVNIQYYLQNYSEKIEQDSYALAEVLQFIWRGCIRDPEGANMKLYLASPRMKSLVMKWLNDE